MIVMGVLYCPGPGWINELLCYEDEKQEKLKNLKLRGRKSGSNNLPILNEEEFEDIDYDNLLKDKEEKYENEEKVYVNAKNNYVFIKEKIDENITGQNKIDVDLLFNKFPDNFKQVNNDIGNRSK